MELVMLGWLAGWMLDQRVPWLNPESEERRLEAVTRLEATQRFCGIRDSSF
jgi:hypothetical protein